MTLTPLHAHDERRGSVVSMAVVVAASDERPRKSDCVRDELLADGSMVLYHTCRQELMTLNPTAALIWECCDGAHSIAMIVAELRDVFPDAPDPQADLLALMRDLLDRAMIADDNL